MKDWLEGAIPNNNKCRVILLLIFLLPIVVATVQHGSSVLYGIIGALALFNFKGGWGILEKQEKHILIGFAIFFLMSALSLLYSNDTKVGMIFLERYTRLLFIIPIYLMIRVQGMDTSRPFLIGAFVGILAMASQAWYQVIILEESVAHGAYHKIILGDMAILFSALVFVAMLHYAKSAWHVGLGIVGIAAGGYASILSYTRASWLFVPIFIVLLIWLFRSKLYKRDLLRILILAGTCVSILFIWQPDKLKDGISQGAADIRSYIDNSNDESSWGSRLNMWHYSILIFKSSPIFGTGIGGYNAASQNLLKKGTISASKKNSFSIKQNNAHSIYFQTLAEGGLVGLLLMVAALLVFPFIYLYKLWQSTTDNDMRFITLAGLTSLVAFAWFGLSAGWMVRNPPITAYSVIILVFLTSTANRKAHLETNDKLRDAAERHKETGQDDPQD